MELNETQPSLSGAFRNGTILAGCRERHNGTDVPAYIVQKDHVGEAEGLLR